jgi:hypothetical protein
MKTISYFLSCTLALVMMIACEDEDRIRIPEYLTAANMRLVVDPQHTQIDYQTVATDFFGVDAYSQNKDIDRVEITVQYQNDTRVIQTLSQADFDDGHQRLEYDANDFAGLFGIPGFADGSRGGFFALRPIVYLMDGRVYPDYVVISAQDSFLNVGTGPAGAANGAFTFRVNTSGTSTDGCCPGEVTVSGNTVQVTMTNATIFQVSDLTGGLYYEWYDVYGITGPDDTPGNLHC